MVYTHGSARPPAIFVAHSSSGLGRRPLKAETTGSNPVWVTSQVRRRAERRAVFVPFYTGGMATDDPKQAYREAYEAWQKHLSGVHELLLEGKRLPPEQIKGLLNREARAKAQYDAARERLLGIDGS